MRAEIIVLLFDATLGNRPLDRHQEFIADQRLRDVVERAGPYGFDGTVWRTVTSY